jgi:pilus assembly protein Flp/PilA
MRTFLLSFLFGEDGATAVEYAVMLALILVVCLGTISYFGTETASSFNGSQHSIANAMNAASS